MSNATQTITSIEKTVLKPKIHEIVYRGEEDPQVSFDVIVGGLSSKDATLGHLCLLGHVTSKGNDDTNYLTSLLGSLARREFYSKESFKDLDARSAFERTVKKLNEVLGNFFASDNLSLHIGVIAVCNGQLMTSRIGKFKIGLVRDSEYIDVINNVDLFKKEASNALQFSNVISGPLESGDKIFAYIPLKSITSREKTIRPVFLSKDQDEFVSKIQQIASENSKFSCCGVHIELATSKEIPIPNSNTHQEELNSISLGQESSNAPVVIRSTSYYSPDQNVEAKTIPTSPSNIYTISSKNTEFPSVLSREVSYEPNKAAVSAIAKIILQTKKVIPKSLKSNSRIAILAVILVLIIGAYIAYPSAESKAVSLANIQYKQATTLASSGDIGSAYKAIDETSKLISSFNGSKALALKAQISQFSRSLLKSDGRQAELYRDMGMALNNDPITHFAIIDKSFIVLTQSSSVRVSTTDALKELGAIKHNPDAWIASGKEIVTLEGSTIRVLELGDKIKVKSAEELTSVVQFPVLFGSNLYGINNDNIAKVADASKGGKKTTVWSKDSINPPVQSLAIDGSLYVLGNHGTQVDVFFKGKKKTQFIVPIPNDDSSRILTTENGATIILISPATKTIYYLDKSTGQLSKSSSFENVTDPKDYQVDIDGSLYILDGSNKIYRL